MSDLKARPYQVELLEKALDENIIVCLGTGTGKTFISVMLIKELSHQIQDSFQSGGKRTFFLVNNVPLVSQQASVIEKNTPLKVRGYYGDMGVDFWDKVKWMDELSKHQVLVMTAQIFLDVLRHDYLSLERVNLIIFDECHHARSKHPYKEIMRQFDSLSERERPKIMGLTASVINEKVRPDRIEFKIRELEYTMKAICQTASDYDEVEKYGTKPDEKIITYSADNSSQSQNEFSQLLDGLLKPLFTFMHDYNASKGGTEDDQLSEKKAHRISKTTISDCRESLMVLGPWCAFQVAKQAHEDIDRHIIDEQNVIGKKFLQSTKSKLKEFQVFYTNHAELTDDVQVIIPDLMITPKVKCLLDILGLHLNDLKEKTSSDTPLMCGIIFVEKRYTALALSKLLNVVAQLDPDFNDVKCCHFTGHAGSFLGVGLRESAMSTKQQQNMMKKFRSHEVNLMVATSVVEEGLDIPKCNLVVRFDPPPNFRSYVQSKGRARASGSKFFLMTESKLASDFHNKLETYHAIENYLQTQMGDDRDTPTEDEFMDSITEDVEIPPYMPRGRYGPRITMTSAVSLVHKYCDKLAKDTYAKQKPIFDILPHGDDYLCKLQLPISCPPELRQPLLGDVMISKQLAKTSVAMEACIKLHKYGELNEKLLPFEEDDESDEEDNEETGGTKTGTKKTRRTYIRKVPDLLKNSLPEVKLVLHVYRITISLTQTARENSASHLWKDEKRCFGIISKEPLPQIPSFSLHPNIGEVRVCVDQCEGSWKSSTRKLFVIQQFHGFLFNEIIRVPETITFEPVQSTGGYYIVALRHDLHGSSYVLDFDFMNIYTEDLSGERKFDNAVVKTDYSGKPCLYHVVKVRHDFSPHSQFPSPSKARTFKDYFLNKYGIELKDQQPMLEVTRVTNKWNFLRSRDAKQQSVIHLPAELCSPQTLPSWCWTQASVLPSALYRFQQVLMVVELRQNVADDLLCDEDQFQVEVPLNNQSTSCGIKSESNFVSDEEFVRKSLAPFFTERSTKCKLPNISLFLQALTSSSAHDAMDLERLEMLGDSFLKLAVTIALYCNNPRAHEGRLTRRRIRQISNKSLFRLADKKQLQQNLFNTELSRVSWLPPVYVYDQQQEEEQEYRSDSDEEMDIGDDSGKDSNVSTFTNQIIPDKTVADCVEALIGAFFISCGHVATLEFMNWLGIEVLPNPSEDQEEDDDSEDNDHFQPRASKLGKYSCFFVPPANHPPPNSREYYHNLISGFSDFERVIEYRFKDKSFLLEAFTHASYYKNTITGCYQRLEFLGDAILDFLVTKHIYAQDDHLSPGQLTDVRSALVNNNTFATIAWKNNYHKHIKQMNPVLFTIVRRFIDKLEEEKAEHAHGSLPMAPESAFIFTSEDDEGFEAPKPLGDIFESVAGAIFLDSDMDLEKVWLVYYKMMKPYIDYYSKNVPLNPVREVHEKDSEADFGKSVDVDGKIKRTLTVFWGSFDGVGRNKKIAKLTAASKALEALREMQQ